MWNSFLYIDNNFIFCCCFFSLSILFFGFCICFLFATHTYISAFYRISLIHHPFASHWCVCWWLQLVFGAMHKEERSENYFFFIAAHLIIASRIQCILIVGGCCCVPHIYIQSFNKYIWLRACNFHFAMNFFLFVLKDFPNVYLRP